jgi:hypothetical protein
MAIGLEHGVVFRHNQEVREPIDVIGIQSLFETVKQILIGPASSGRLCLEVCYKLTKGAFALLHPDDLVLYVGLGTDQLELQFERRKKGVLVCKRCLAFRERFYVESDPHSCVFDHEGEGQRDHFVYIKQGSSVSSLHLLSLWIAECETILIRVDPNTKGTPE